MKTQGITLMTSRTTEVKVTKKTTNASDSTFENFIASNASGLSRQTAGQNASIADTKSSMESKSSKIQPSDKSEDGASSKITQSKDANNTQVNNNETGKSEKKIDTVSETKSTEQPKAENEVIGTKDTPLVAEDGTIDITQVNEEIMAILQDILNLLPQDVKDIFDQMGMQPSDLITGLKTGEIESFSITTVQTFVMEVHGIEDPGAFLTNDLLNTEMNEIFDRIKTLVSEMMRVDVPDLDKLEKSVWDSFSENLIQAAHPEETVQTVQVSETEPKQEITLDTEQAETESTKAPDMNIIIENQTSDQAGSGTGQNTGQGSGLGTDNLRDAAADLKAMENQPQATTNAQAFAEALTEAVAPEPDQAADVQRQMTEMVEQVVRQVRIRMMPESTNMELQLHPASLGRVHVQINATGQETTARLVVENQAARDALESGMIRLQEAFEERGLKVQAVEVTIGNFDLGLNQETQGEAQPDDSGQNGRRGGQGSQSGNGEIPVTERGETEESRRDINSTVDYTA